MAEYIEREAAIKAIYDSDPNGIRRTLGFNVGQIEEALRAIPTADVATVQHGRWQYNTDFYVWRCSECGENPHKGTGVVTTAEKLPAYCPNCGAKMDGAE